MTSHRIYPLLEMLGFFVNIIHIMYRDLIIPIVLLLYADFKSSINRKAYRHAAMLSELLSLLINF